MHTVCLEILLYLTIVFFLLTLVTFNFIIFFTVHIKIAVSFHSKKVLENRWSQIPAYLESENTLSVFEEDISIFSRYQI